MLLLCTSAKTGFEVHAHFHGGAVGDHQDVGQRIDHLDKIIPVRGFEELRGLAADQAGAPQTVLDADLGRLWGDRRAVFLMEVLHHSLFGRHALPHWLWVEKCHQADLPFTPAGQSGFRDSLAIELRIGRAATTSGTEPRRHDKTAPRLKPI